MISTDKGALRLLSFLLAGAALVLTRVHGPDLFFISVGDDHVYYSYARDLLTQHSFSFQSVPLNVFTQADGRFIAARFPAGPGLLWFPFLLISHGIARFLPFENQTLVTQGISVTEFLGTAVGSTLYGMMSLYFLYLFLRRYFSVSASLWSVILVGLSSPLVYYLFRRPLMSHATEMFAISGAFYFLSGLHENVSKRYVATAAAFIAFVFLTRWTYAPLCAILSLWACCLLVSRKPGFFNRLTVNHVVFIGVASLAVIFQLLLWKHLTGHFYPGMQALRSSSVGSSLFFAIYPWSLRHLRDLWIGPDWGMLWLSPITAISLIAFFFLLRDSRLRSIGLLLGSTGLIFLWMFSNWPTHGGEYGNRYLIYMWIPFAFSFAYALENAHAKGNLVLARSLVVLGSLSLLHSLFMLTLFKSNDDSLTLHVAPNLYGMTKDWVNHSYVRNATVDLLRHPVHALSTFGVSALGYFGMETLESLSLLPSNARAAWQGYLSRHTSPHWFHWVLLMCSWAGGFFAMTKLSERLMKHDR